MNKLSGYDLGWLTGLFEGEGCASVRPIKGRLYPQLTISSTDSDVLEWGQQITGMGTVSGPHFRDHRPDMQNRKGLYVWVVTGIDNCQVFLSAIYDGLSARRQEQADKVLALKYAGTPRE